MNTFKHKKSSKLMSSSHEHQNDSHSSEHDTPSGVDRLRFAMDQAAQDRWQQEGARLGKRRVMVDVTRPPADLPRMSNVEPKREAFISPVRPGALEDAYRIRREESLRAAAERQDFDTWESELVNANLDTATAAMEAFGSEHVATETPEGVIETDEVTIDEEIHITVARDETAVVEREEITDAESGERHVIETSLTESGAAITLDGEPVDETDLSLIEAVNEHIAEQIVASQQDASRPVEQQPVDERVTPDVLDQQLDRPKSEPTTEKSIGRGKNARSFFKAMSANPAVRQHLAGTLREHKLSSEQFNEMLEQATDEDAVRMRQLFEQAGPKSGIWAERPGSSALGRAAQAYHDELSAIITGFIER